LSIRADSADPTIFFSKMREGGRGLGEQHPEAALRLKGICR